MARRTSSWDKFLLFYGIVVGSVLGFFGNIYADWYYETYKDHWWFPTVVFVSLLMFLGVLLFATVKMMKWSKDFRKEEF